MASSEELRGPWATTVSGRRVYLLDPTPDSISLHDIAHHLSLICRFGGATQRFYSVAEHCVRGADKAPDERTALLFLLHDAPEYVIGDIVTPIKKYLPGAPHIAEMERRIERAIYKSFGVAPPTAEEARIVKEIDERMFATEWRALTTWSKQDAFTTSAAGRLGDVEPYEDMLDPASGGMRAALTSEYVSKAYELYCSTLMAEYRSACIEGC